MFEIQIIEPFISRKRRNYPSKKISDMIRFNYLSTAILAGILGMGGIMTGCKNENKDKPTTAGPVRVDVEVAGSTGATTSGGQKYSGTVEAAEASTVSFPVPGTITKIYVEEGQKVSKGQLIAQVKSESLVNSRNIAKAELEEARDAYQRLKKLHDANALPDIKWVEIQSKLKQAENAMALADRAVSDASLHSPITGYVSQKFANDGQTVIPAEPIVKIVSLKDLQVAISVPESEIAEFGPTTTATVTFESADSLTVSGKVDQKGVVADPLTRSYTVKFDLGNTDGKILPGMIGTVVTAGSDTDSVSAGTVQVVVPSQAVLLSSDNRQFVWIVKGGKAERRYVEADELTSNGVTVKKGLTAGDSVIVAGMQKVSTGTAVTVTR